MKIFHCTSTVLAMMLAVGGTAFAADFPMQGQVHNTSDVSALTYECKEVSSERIECNFIQTAVRHNAKEEDWPEKREAAIKNIEEELAGCDAPNGPMTLMRDYALLLSGDLSPEELLDRNPKGISNISKFHEGIAQISDREKKFIIEMVEASDKACETKDEKDVIALHRFLFEREMKTCRAMSFQFTQSFKWIQGTGNEAGAWVNDSSPTGPCGIVQLNRFERADDTDFSLAWNYISKKVVTNPKGEEILLGSCKNYDENEYLFEWTAQERFMDCDYIKFSVF